MILIFKRKKLSFMIVAAIVLIVSMFLIKIGFANKIESIPSEQSIENIQILAGAIDIEGEGISITLTDNESNKHDAQYIIHDLDLVSIVNLLTSAGAEVISINDERLISISKIEANKMMIKVNNNEYSSPFIIKAIGDPQVLSDALKTEESYTNFLKEYVEVKIEKEDKLFIPKYKGDIYFKYAKPVEINE